MRKFNIGNVKLDNNIILAPMAGITDLPLRHLAKSGGAGLVYTGMVSATALSHNDEKTKKLLKISSGEKPVSVQIFGADACIMSEAAKIVRDMDADIIDINLGCPTNKIVKVGAGVRLLNNERLVTKILESVVKSVDIPVTLKTRIGLFPGENIASKIIKIAQNCGIKMVAIHTRAASQRHSGDTNLKLFAEACNEAKIPVVANGGIVDEKTAVSFLQVPNCKGIMIGRGALGNYSIFKGLENFFNSGESLSLPSKTEKINWLKEHVESSVEYYGERKGLVVVRKVVNYYIKNLPNAAKIRDVFNKIVSLSDFNELMRYLEII